MSDEFGAWTAAETASSKSAPSADEFGSWVSSSQSTNASFVGSWVAASNLTATFDLAVHNLWELRLEPDGTFSFTSKETVSYPMSGRPGHVDEKILLKGTWTAGSNAVQLQCEGGRTIILSHHSSDLGMPSETRRLVSESPFAGLPMPIAPSMGSNALVLQSQ